MNRYDFETRAEKGDGFAMIAVGLFEIASAIRSYGPNYVNGDEGQIESIASAINRIADTHNTGRKR